VALTRLWAVVLVACAAPPEAKPGMPRTEEPKAARTVTAVQEVEEDRPPEECGRETWRKCLALARSLEANKDPGYHPQAIRLYRLMCNTGDDRRCFEPDADHHLRAECKRKGFAEACLRLGELHAAGEATCPVDDACADVLFEMACNAGEAAACERRAAR
jgi:hypothetical protein